MVRRIALSAMAAMMLGATCAARAEEVPPSPTDLVRPKKLIAVAWELYCDTAWIRAHRDAYEAGPFDGLVINVEGRDDAGKPVLLRQAHTRGAWKEAWFAAAIDDLKACRFSKLTDNFIMIHANPGDVDWFDDAAWADVVQHWRLAARVARAVGAKGLGFDPEPYNPPHAPFCFTKPPQGMRKTFAETSAQARRRGREVMRAVAEEFPDAVILSFFLNSICRGATGHADAGPLLASDGYGLLPSFVDGWLDVAPPGVRLVDGTEHAYRFNDRLAFLDAANGIRGACRAMASPENRAKYAAQVQVGFGIYLDAHVNPPTSPWYIDPLGGTRTERLRANVSAACEAANEYVWIYGEKYRWFPTPHKGVSETTWPEILPGAGDALRAGRDLRSWALWKVDAMAKAGTLRNVLPGGDFSNAKGEGDAARPEGWSTWQDDDSHGRFAHDAEAGNLAPGCGRLSGMADGCFLRKVDVAPGRSFAVRAGCRKTGHGDARIVIRWQDAKDRWVSEAKDVPVPCPPGEGWQKLFGVAEVPPEAARLVVLLLVRGQRSPDDAAWFDDVEVFPLDAPAP
jgi:hypothetical protein